MLDHRGHFARGPHVGGEGRKPVPMLTQKREDPPGVGRFVVHPKRRESQPAAPADGLVNRMDGRPQGILEGGVQKTRSPKPKTEDERAEPKILSE